MRSKTQTEPVPTFESVLAGLKETNQGLKETNQGLKEIRQVFTKFSMERKEAQKKRDKERKEAQKERDKERKEAQKETREMKKELERMYAESRRESKELNRQLGGISNSNGEMAETYFYNAFKANKRFANELYDHVQRPTRITNGDIEAEFDIILFNGTSVAIIEVKYNANPENIAVRRLIERVEVFKILYPNYKNHSVYLGVAAMTFRNGLEKRLHRNGIATIRQIGKKMVVYDQEVKPF